MFVRQVAALKLVEGGWYGGRDCNGKKQFHAARDEISPKDRQRRETTLGVEGNLEHEGPVGGYRKYALFLELELRLLSLVLRKKENQLGTYVHIGI